ncbi:hypothetical protein HAX54_047717 [Datura stramonium]|uniref:Uncharacterized protein n=1 Tax=Datura stramonium TaxID=4076 RepID=A0ABS8WMC7_DATST|nr:hypothetical protein [Datura stramonium]
MEFHSKFEPLESCPDQNIDKLKGDLAGVTTIKRDLTGVKKDDATSKAINEVVECYAAGDATRIDDHHSYGGGYTQLDTSGAGGRYTLAIEEVGGHEDTPHMLDRSSAVGASKLPSCACEISEPFTPVGVKRRRYQISRALASAKKKDTDTLKMTVDQPTEQLPVNLYKYADDKKKKKIQQMIKAKRSTKNLYIMHKFNYQDVEHD